ncbi:MAG TPA: hypothetical protein VME20_09185 [Acidimicrobiales bacterium]|nr:hypothetical protein [Acidimicrobiales bacterium]
MRLLSLVARRITSCYQSINPTGILSPGSRQFQRAEKASQSLGNGGFDEEFSS